MRDNAFLNWLGQTLLGFVLVGGSLQVAWMFGLGFYAVSIPCGVVALVGIAIITRAELIERPRRILRNARRSLSFPTQWSVKFDKRLACGGVIPIAVIRSDGVRFVIDISGETSVHWGTPVDGSGEAPLVGAKGKPLRPDPIAPLTKAALTASAAPVLWLPQAAQANNLRHPQSNLIVVMGTARDLKHALQGAEIVPPRAAPKAAAKDVSVGEVKTASVRVREPVVA